MSKPLPSINNAWTLFLDRDGVLNEDNIHGYILNWEEFHFYAGVLEAMKILANEFPRIFLVTNQRGVGKGLMSESELERIHTNMQKAIEEQGGRLDKVFYCTATTNDHPDRKPNTGMATKARALYPEIDFTKSIMVGNTSGDMEFGRRIGAYTVYIHTREDKIPTPQQVDARFDSLHDFAKALQAS